MKKFPSLKPEASHAQALEAYEVVVRRLVIEDRAEAGHMFGMPCVKSKGKAFAGFYKGDLVVKLSGEALENAMALKGAHLFDPMGGRPMKQWMQVPFAVVGEWEGLAKRGLEGC